MTLSILLKTAFIEELIMLSWEEMTPIEKAQSIYWDAYKDAFGFRPRDIDTTEWLLSDFHKEIMVLEQVIAENGIQRLQDEAVAADKVERTILNLLEAGAKDREMCVRWLLEAHDCGEDRDYLCFLLGVAYGYFN
jgi:hypothetical protein